MTKILSLTTAEEKREAKVREIEHLCHLLNEAGATPRWTRFTLNRYINVMFSVDDGVDCLGFESFEELKNDLTPRLTAREAYNASLARNAGHPSTPQSALRLVKTSSGAGESYDSQM